MPDAITDAEIEKAARTVAEFMGWKIIDKEDAAEAVFTLSEKWESCLGGGGMRVRSVVKGHEAAAMWEDKLAKGRDGITAYRRALCEVTGKQTEVAVIANCEMFMTASPLERLIAAARAIRAMKEIKKP